MYIHTQLYPCIMASTSFEFLLAHINFYAIFAILLMLLLPSGLIGCSRKKVDRFLITDYQQMDYDPLLLPWFLYTPFFIKNAVVEDSPFTRVDATDGIRKNVLMIVVDDLSAEVLRSFNKVIGK